MRSFTRNGVPTVGIASFIVLLAVATIGVTVFSATQTATHTGCVVTDKDRVANSNGESEMRVYTENCGTFTANDSLLDAKFNSADLYASIEVGQTYDFDTRGVRFPLFSMFPNIIRAHPVG